MKLLINPTTDEIWYAMRDAGILFFKHTTNITLTEATVDEVSPDNVEICQALDRHNHFAVNEQGQRRFYISEYTDPVTIGERENWTEYMPEVM